MKGYDVICAGLMVMDIFAYGVEPGLFERDTFLAERVKYETGGDALNVAVNLGRLGARAAMSGAVGQDFAGDSIMQRLLDSGVSTEFVTRTESEPTATSIVLCEPGGGHHFLYYGGANDRYDGSGLNSAALSQAGILYIGSFLGLPALDGAPLLELLRRAKAQGLATVVDACGVAPSDDKARLLAGMLPFVDVFFPSEAEAGVLSGETDYRAAAEYFIRHGAGVAGVKLGARGCYLTNGRWEESVPALPCDEPLDTTGAGDAFMAGYVRGMTLGEGPAGCARLGAAMGYACIQSLGATTHASSLESILALADRLP